MFHNVFVVDRSESKVCRAQFFCEKNNNEKTNYFETNTHPARLLIYIYIYIYIENNTHASFYHNGIIKVKHQRENNSNSVALYMIGIGGEGFVRGEGGGLLLISVPMICHCKQVRFCMQSIL